MTYRLRITALAQDDLGEARIYYEHALAGLGGQFEAAMESLLKSIVWNPKMFASGYRGVRAAKRPRFPYVVRYRIVGELIEVFAVTHERRRAKAWTSRI